MDKQVKEVFKNCVREDNMFNLATVKEIKYSKKLNAVILDSYSPENIPQSDIEEFERLAKSQYELSSFKIMNILENQRILIFKMYMTLFLALTENMIILKIYLKIVI